MCSGTMGLSVPVKITSDVLVSASWNLCNEKINVLFYCVVCEQSRA